MFLDQRDCGNTPSYDLYNPYGCGTRVFHRSAAARYTSLDYILWKRALGQIVFELSSSIHDGHDILP